MKVAPPPVEYDQFYIEQLVDQANEARDARTTGEVFYHTGTPNKALACDGSAVSRVTYEGLFAVVSTTFGSGDGSTTFNLPTVADLQSGISAWIRT